MSIAVTFNEDDAHAEIRDRSASIAIHFDLFSRDGRLVVQKCEVLKVSIEIINSDGSFHRLVEEEGPFRVNDGSGPRPAVISDYDEVVLAVVKAWKEMQAGWAEETANDEAEMAARGMDSYGSLS